MEFPELRAYPVMEVGRFLKQKKNSLRYSNTEHESIRNQEDGYSDSSIIFPYSQTDTMSIYRNSGLKVQK